MTASVPVPPVKERRGKERETAGDDTACGCRSLLVPLARERRRGKKGDDMTVMAVRQPKQGRRRPCSPERVLPAAWYHGEGGVVADDVREAELQPWEGLLATGEPSGKVGQLAEVSAMAPSGVGGYAGLNRPTLCMCGCMGMW